MTNHRQLRLCRPLQKTSRRKMRIFVVCMVLMFREFTAGIIIHPDPRDSVTTCYTPDGNLGNCKELSECWQVDQMLKKSSHMDNYTDILNFVRRSHCGFIGDKSQVCCPDTNSFLPDLSICGQYASEDKVSGKTTTELNEFPWISLVKRICENENSTYSDDIHGTLINSRYLLTVNDDNCTPIRVKLGEYDLSTDIDCLNNECAPFVEEIDVEDHSALNEFLIIKLRHEVQFSRYITPICLPIRKRMINRDYSGKNLHFSGWHIKLNDTETNVKQKLRLPIHSKKTCMKIVENYKENELCVGGLENAGPCNNIGAPLMALENYLGKTNWYLVGVFKKNLGSCGQKGTPSIFLKIAPYIRKIIEDKDECVENKRLCEFKCVNTLGSYRCECQEGYRALSNGKCADMDECAINKHNCNACQKCINLDGSFKCVCSENCRFVNGECQDINECAENVTLCGHKCVNTIGSYRCECPQGYRTLSNGSCTDIDECMDSSEFRCLSNADCVNLYGGYHCRLPCVERARKTKNACSCPNCHIEYNCNYNIALKKNTSLSMNETLFEIPLKEHTFWVHNFDTSFFELKIIDAKLVKIYLKRTIQDQRWLEYSICSKNLTHGYNTYIDIFISEYEF